MTEQRKDIKINVIAILDQLEGSLKKAENLLNRVKTGVEGLSSTFKKMADESSKSVNTLTSNISKVQTSLSDIDTKKQQKELRDQQRQKIRDIEDATRYNANLNAARSSLSIRTAGNLGGFLGAVMPPTIMGNMIPLASGLFRGAGGLLAGGINKTLGAINRPLGSFAGNLVGSAFDFANQFGASFYQDVVNDRLAFEQSSYRYGNMLGGDSYLSGRLPSESLKWRVPMSQWFNQTGATIRALTPSLGKGNRFPKMGMYANAMHRGELLPESLVQSIAISTATSESEVLGLLSQAQLGGRVFPSQAMGLESRNNLAVYPRSDAFKKVLQSYSGNANMQRVLEVGNEISPMLYSPHLINTMFGGNLGKNYGMGFRPQEYSALQSAANRFIGQQVQNFPTSDNSALAFQMSMLGMYGMKGVSIANAHRFAAQIFEAPMHPGGGQAGQSLMWQAAGYRFGMNPYKTLLALEDPTNRESLIQTQIKYFTGTYGKGDMARYGLAKLLNVPMSAMEDLFTPYGKGTQYGKAYEGKSPIDLILSGELSDEMRKGALGDLLGLKGGSQSGYYQSRALGQRDRSLLATTQQVVGKDLKYTVAMSKEAGRTIQSAMYMGNKAVMYFASNFDEYLAKPLLELTQTLASTDLTTIKGITTAWDHIIDRLKEGYNLVNPSPSPPPGRRSISPSSLNERSVRAR